MKKRGRGIACIYHGIGYSASPSNASSATIEVNEDGSAIVLCGAADIGQGSDTALGQIAAEVLGISPEQVTVISTDTMAAPDAWVTAASRQTYVSGNAIRFAAEQAKEILLKEAANYMEENPIDLEARNNRIFVRGDPKKYLTVKEVCAQLRRRGVPVRGIGTYNPPAPESLDPETGLGIPYGTYSYATQIAEVEVDTETGELTILNICAAHDVGKAINPLAVEGQIEGGVSQGIGFALMEEVIVENGVIQNPSFSNLLIPTSLDVPTITSIIVEEPEPTGPFGAKGLGEPPSDPTAAAIINAIYDAIGIRITSTPVTAEKIYMALKQKQKEADKNT